MLPDRSEAILTRDEALAYYAARLVGDHEVAIGAARVVVRFNPEETHLFTDERTPCPDCDVVRRAARYAEVRCFSRERARRMDAVLDTLRSPAAALEARMRGGVTVFGPADRNAQRLAVVVAPAGARVWFVRTVWPSTAQEFRQACRGGRAAPWPPK